MFWILDLYQKYDLQIIYPILLIAIFGGALWSPNVFTFVEAQVIDFSFGHFAFAVVWETAA